MTLTRRRDLNLNLNLTVVIIIAILRIRIITLYNSQLCETQTYQPMLRFSSILSKNVARRVPLACAPACALLSNLSIIIVHLTRENTTTLLSFKMQVSSKSYAPRRRCHYRHQAMMMMMMIGAMLFLVSSYSSTSDEVAGVCRENQESNRHGFFFVSAAEEEEETPMEHIMETFSGTDSILQEEELDRFLHALQTGGKSEEEDGHDDHEEEAHAASVSAKELLREYGALGDSSTSLTEAEFTSACP